MIRFAHLGYRMIAFQARKTLENRSVFYLSDQSQFPKLIMALPISQSCAVFNILLASPPLKERTDVKC